MHLSVLQNIMIRCSSPINDTAIWCLSGFGDSSLAFSALFEAEITASAQIIAPDLPGFGASPVNNHECTIAAYVDTLLELIADLTPDAKIGLVGHSAGSVIAVEAALKLGNRCWGVFSVEGNLTEEDAYFSGQAADFDDAQVFKNAFIEKIWKKGKTDNIFRSYFTSLNQADAIAMWRFGKDMRSYSKEDLPGKKITELVCPFLYFWCPDNTPAAAQEFLSANKLKNVKIARTSHWPMIDAPKLIENHLSNFFRKTRSTWS